MWEQPPGSLENYAPADIMLPYAQLGVARACAAAGEKDKARAAYQDFFARWKNADPDLPVLKEAKAEYAKVQWPRTLRTSSWKSTLEISCKSGPSGPVKRQEISGLQP
jgi:hypothetical protein